MYPWIICYRIKKQKMCKKFLNRKMKQKKNRQTIYGWD